MTVDLESRMKLTNNKPAQKVNTPDDDDDDYAISDETRRAVMVAEWVIAGGQSEAEFNARQGLGHRLLAHRISLGFVEREDFIRESDLEIIDAEMLLYLEDGWVTNEEMRHFMPHWVAALNSLGADIDVQQYLSRIPGQPPESKEFGL